MSKARALVLALICSCVAIACGPRAVELAPGLVVTQPEGSAIPGLRALRITPGAIEVTYDGTALNEPALYRAIGSFDDGERDLSERVGWSLGRAALGDIRGGRFEHAAVGGVTTVNARAGEVTASAELRVRLDIVLNRAGLNKDELALFEQGDTVSAESSPRIVYPADGTILPGNLAYLHTQWRAPAEFDRFELRIEGPFSRLRYYTDQRSWRDDAVSSQYLAPSHAGSAVTLSVRAFASSAPSAVYHSSVLHLQVSNAAAGSGVYYWSTTARGIKRGHLAADLATQVMSETAVGPERCAGCHALSRDGTRLAFSNQMERLALVALPEQNELTFAALPPSAAMPAMPALSGPGGMAAPPMPTPMAMPMMPKKDAKPRAAPDYGWGTFNPAGTRLLYADKGKLHLIDVASGQEVGKVELQPGAAATHPDWAPDGRAVAVTYAPEGKKLAGNKQVLGTSIARLPVRDDGTLGAPEIIVASSGPEDTLFYPSYAPDGRWLAFVRAQGPAKDSASAQVYLTASDATTASSASAPVALENVAIGSSLPTWLPEIVAGQGFLAFSSTRDYGDVLVNTERDQLWAAAIDFKRLAAGADPSAPAFWLPFQDPLESNHRALWSVSANDVCPSLREQCNGRDDDCDGALDEDCCTPSAEICGDGIDNDCDGVPDEGCGCGTVDACDNQLDDDCDQKIDEDCRAL